jgi:hypothetical protein
VICCKFILFPFDDAVFPCSCSDSTAPRYNDAT